MKYSVKQDEYEVELPKNCPSFGVELPKNFPSSSAYVMFENKVVFVLFCLAKGYFKIVLGSSTSEKQTLINRRAIRRQKELPWQLLSNVLR